MLCSDGIEIFLVYIFVQVVGSFNILPTCLLFDLAWRPNTILSLEKECCMWPFFCLLILLSSAYEIKIAYTPFFTWTAVSLGTPVSLRRKPSFERKVNKYDIILFIP